MPPFPLGLATETSAWGRWTTRALDLLLPPHCVGCDARVLNQGEFCAPCFTRLGPITAPYCDACGLPFAAADLAGPEGLCAACLARPPVFGKGRAGFVYGGMGREVVLGFKHADRPNLARALAPHLVRAGADLLEGAPLLVPVPLHRWRLFRRGYNQAAQLAREIGRIGRCPTGLDTLRRVRATPSLGERGAEERRAVVAGAFAMRQGRRSGVAGRAVALIDDVMTSGATLDACAGVLLEAGAARVDALVAARVPLSRTA